MIALRVLAFLVGLAIVLYTLRSAIRTFVLPRSANETLTRVVFSSVRALYNFRMRWATTYAERDRIMELYAPLSTLARLGGVARVRPRRLYGNVLGRWRGGVE